MCRRWDLSSRQLGLQLHSWIDQVECSPRLSYDGIYLTYLDKSYIILSYEDKLHCNFTISSRVLSIKLVIIISLKEVSYLRYINIKIFFYRNWLWSKRSLLNLTLLLKLRRRGKNVSFWNSKSLLNVKNAMRGSKKRNTWENTNPKYIHIKRHILL